MKQIIELLVPNTLKKGGVSGIFYEGPRICVSYKSRLITFKVDKESQAGTLERFDKLVGATIEQPTKNDIKLCIAANWELVITCRTEIPVRELDQEALELNQREHLDRLDKLCRFSSNPIPQPSSSSLQNKKKSHSSIFTTYVTIEENKTSEVQ